MKNPIVRYALSTIAVCVAPTAFAQSVTDRVLEALRPSAPTNSRLATAAAIATLCPAGNRLNARLQSDCNTLVGSAFQSVAGVADAVGRITPDDSSIQAGGTQNRALMDVSSQRLGGFRGDQAAALAHQPGILSLRHAMGDGLDSQWSVFAQFDWRNTEHDDGGDQAGFDHDSRTGTIGIDGSFGEQFNLGFAVNAGSGDVDLSRTRGGQEYDQRGFSLYGNFAATESFYIDGIVSRSKRDIDQTRNIAYSLGTTAVRQIFRSRYDTDATNIALRFGWNLGQDAWQINPYLGIDRDSADVDGYREDAGALANDNGAGWAVGVNSQKYSATTGRAGLRLAYAMSTGSGVILPFVDLRWANVFSSDEKPAQVFFLGDTSTGSNSIVVWQQFPDRQDESYAEINLGLSAQFADGISGFLRYQRAFAQDDFDTDQFGIGARIEF